MSARGRVPLNGEPLQLLLSEEELGERIDRVLAQLLGDEGISRSQVEKLIEQGRVTLDGKLVRSKSFVPERPGILLVTLPEFPRGTLQPDSSVQFERVFEDDELAVINKPAGLTMHPGGGGEEHTLAHGLLAAFGESILKVGHPQRPGIVHRLDKDTSGLLVVAKTVAAYTNLTNQFLPPRTIHRTYLALTRSAPRGKQLPEEGTISKSIARDPKNRLRMTLSADGREAITHFRIRETFSSALLVELRLETGRTHQIRVHLESLGIPILGDELYTRGQVDSPLQETVHRQQLHAWKLQFLHPKLGSEMTFEAPLPADMEELLRKLRSYESAKN